MCYLPSAPDTSLPLVLVIYSCDAAFRDPDIILSIAVKYKADSLLTLQRLRQAERCVLGVSFGARSAYNAHLHPGSPY